MKIVPNLRQVVE